MIYIQKNQEPKSLTEYKKQSNAYYDGCNKSDIREQLLKEQGHLCAYCMRRIHEDDMKIEHWDPRDGDDDSKKALNYNNMLGVCQGHLEEREEIKKWTWSEAGKEKRKGDTCDASKGNQKITVNPLRYETLNSIHYSSKNGEIHAMDPQIENDLTQILNLNSAKHRLPLYRKEKLDGVIDELTRTLDKGQKLSSSKITKVIQKYEGFDKDGYK